MMRFQDSCTVRLLTDNFDKYRRYFLNTILKTSAILIIKHQEEYKLKL